MSIKPIDLQTNIAHLHEIAKNEHGKLAVFVEREHSLEKDAEENSRSIKNKLEENKHAEKTSIMREEEHRKKKEKRFKRDDKNNKDNAEENNDFLKFENIGLNIDVKR